MRRRTATRVDRPGNIEAKRRRGEQKPKQTEGLQLLYDITLKMPNNDKSLSHTRTHTKAYANKNSFFATLQHFTRVSTCLLLIVLSF